MEKIFDEDTINELNGIYGIENCKWEILDYIRYLKISKENHFVNYNIMINNDEDKKTKIWNDLKEIYFYLKEWYEDIEIYHLIGYKIYFELKNYKNNVAYIIADLIKKYREKDKDEFKKYLYETIFISLYNNYKEAYKPKNKENKFIWLDDIIYVRVIFNII